MSAGSGKAWREQKGCVPCFVVRKKREKQEIGISSIRGGTIVGEHEVIFAGHDEVITLSHTAMSKEIFAQGATNAALFLQNQPAGFYAMKDLVGAL